MESLGFLSQKPSGRISRLTTPRIELLRKRAQVAVALTKAISARLNEFQADVSLFLGCAYARLPGKAKRDSDAYVQFAEGFVSVLVDSGGKTERLAARILLTDYVIDICRIYRDSDNPTRAVSEKLESAKEDISYICNGGAVVQVADLLTIVNKLVTNKPARAQLMDCFIDICKIYRNVMAIDANLEEGDGDTPLA